MHRIEDTAATVTTGLIQLQPASTEEGPSLDAGRALETSRAEDQAWRATRNAAMQRRLDRAVRLGELGHRMRACMWYCFWGAAILCVFAIPFNSLVEGRPEFERMAAVLILGCPTVFLLGMVLWSLSKTLRVTSQIWRKWLRQSARDHLEVRDPARSPD